MKEKPIKQYLCQEGDIGLDATVMNVVRISSTGISGIYNHYDFASGSTNEEGNSEADCMELISPRENSEYGMMLEFSGSPVVSVYSKKVIPKTVPVLPAWNSSKLCSFHSQIVVGRYYAPNKEYIVYIWREESQEDPIKSISFPFDDQTQQIELIADLNIITALVSDRNSLQVSIKIMDIDTLSITNERIVKLDTSNRIYPITIKSMKVYFLQKGKLLSIDLQNGEIKDHKLSNLVNSKISDDGKTIYLSRYDSKVQLVLFDVETDSVTEQIDGEIDLHVDNFHHWIIRKDKSLELIQVPHLKRTDNYRIYQKFYQLVNQATSTTDASDPLQELIPNFDDFFRILASRSK